MTLPINNFAQVTIEQNADVRLSDKARYNRKRRLSAKKPYWEINLTTPALEYAEGMAVSAYLDSLLGEFKRFSIPNPLPALASRKGVTTSQNQNSGSEQVSLSGFQANQLNAVMAGDFIRFSGHAKVYRVVRTQNANASGVASVQVTPPLFQHVAAATRVYYGSDVVFQVSLKGNQEMKVSAANADYIAHNIKLIEQG